MMTRTIAALFAVAMPFSALQAAPERSEMIEIDSTTGEMSVPLPGEGDIGQIGDGLRFEPLQNFDEMFLRDDVVFLMRHGPTDWSKLDVKDVNPEDCASQRIMSDEGRRNMRDMGALLAHNDIRFGEVVVSQWCRNQETYDMLKEGYDSLKPNVFGRAAKVTDPEMNLLLSLQGARTVSGLERRVREWDGGDGEGPLLIISHFTNIQELTEFSVYEGEMLVLDPKRDNRVLGYLRLRSARPDVGHFDSSAVEGATPVGESEAESPEG